MEEEEYKGYLIRIQQDEFAENPLHWNDEPAITYNSYSRYILGNKPVDDPCEWRRTKRKELKAKDPRTRLDQVMIEYPVYAYIHGGVALSLSPLPPFNCPWDSGQSGVIYISRKTAKEGFWKRGMSEEDFQERVRKYLEGVLSAFNDYIEGHVFEFSIEDGDGEQMDGCSGFFGVDHEESGLMDAARQSIDTITSGGKD